MAKAKDYDEQQDLQRRLDTLTRVSKAIHLAARRLDPVPGYTDEAREALLEDGLKYMRLRRELETVAQERLGND